MKQNSKLSHFEQLFFSFKNENGRQNRSSGAKTGHKGGREPQLSARVTLVP